MLNAPNKQAIDNTVCSPLMTSSATRDLKAGLWFLRFDILISSIVEDQSNQK
ncbi:MAG: hypothetical protein JKX72_07375 [Robiginitomaculum sp.]|nr:hypothetical protein [Robiginitomaculum sp.]